MFLLFHQLHIECRVSRWSEGVEVEGSVNRGFMDVICIVVVYQSFHFHMEPISDPRNSAPSCPDTVWLSCIGDTNMVVV